jgi:uncharacterized membrane protein
MSYQLGEAVSLFAAMFFFGVISSIILGITSFYNKNKDLNDIKNSLWFAGAFSGASTLFAGLLIFHEFKWYWRVILALMLICFCFAAVIAWYDAASQDISYASARNWLLAGWIVCLVASIASAVFLTASIKQKYFTNPRQPQIRAAQ